MWRIELLGEPRVVGQHNVISRFESRRVVALLAYLALYPETRHPREVLVDRLWPEASIESGRNRLKQALASLRRQLEPPGTPPGSVLDADRNHIGLRSGSFVCDVDDFKLAISAGEYSKARSIRRGELLPGFYDEWLDDVRLKLSAFEEDIEDFHMQDEPVAAAPQQAAQTGVHLPAALTSFVGREDECSQVLSALESNRMVTVTGFGGLGKTRLTLRVAGLWGKGEVWFVPLASTVDPSGLLPAIAGALRLELTAESRPLDSIKAALGKRESLLVLDNMEQLAGPQIRKTLSDLLREVPTLRILASSRLALKVEGEVESSLWPFEVPEPGEDLETLSQNPGIRLFVDRARQVRPDFQVTKANAAQLEKVCRELEGIPLAIELCASWAHFGVTRVLELLESGPQHLESLQKSQEDRHRSLQRVFEATCSALSTSARRLLGHLSIFRSGWDWETVESVCGSMATAEALSELIEASIVRPVFDTDPPRFLMLECLREMSQGLLRADEASLLEASFCTHFCSLASRSARNDPVPELDIRTQAHWIDLLLREWANFRATAAVLKTAGRSQELVQFLHDTEWFWSLYTSDAEFLQTMLEACSTLEGRWGRLARLISLSHLLSSSRPEEVDAAFQAAFDDLQKDRDPQLAGECQLRWAKVKILRQDMASLRQLAEQARVVFAESGDKVGEGQALHILANCAIQDVDADGAFRFVSESEACFRNCGSLINLAAVTYTKARHFYMQGKFEECLPVLFVCRDVARGLHNMRFMGRTANLFGVVLRHLNQEPLARVYFYLSLVANVRSREVRGAHMPLWNLYLSLGSEGRWDQAVPVMASAMAIWHDYFGSELDQDDQSLLTTFLHDAKEALGPMRFSELESAGRSWTVETAEQQLKCSLAGELTNHSEDVRSFFVS